MKNYGEGIIAIGEELSQLLQLVSISQCEFLWSRILGYRIRDWKEKKSSSVKRRIRTWWP